MAVSSISTRAPGRRAFLGGAAAAALITAVPSAIAAAEPDSELTALFRRWQAAAAAYEHALDHYYEVEELREHPEEPDALFRRSADFHSFSGFLGSRYYGRDRFWYGDEASIDYLRDAKLAWQQWIGGIGESPVVEVPDQRARERRDEILAA